MAEQKVFPITDETADAVETNAKSAAVEMSERLGRAKVILSGNNIYVEHNGPMIRTWEYVIAEYENGRNVGP